MTSAGYEPFLPIILNWICDTLVIHASRKRPVASFRFTRLPAYFSDSILDTTNVVITDHPPVLPLSKMGLSEFADFEAQPMAGITYQDTYFLEPRTAGDESAHFHELVHVVQWRVLGPRDFLLLYAAGLVERGYMECPLEAAAYGHQRRFDAGHGAYSVETEVRSRVLALEAGA